MHRGEVFYANLSPVIGSEQGGKRPVLIIQNNKGNLFSPTIIIAPISQKNVKKQLPTQVAVSLPLKETMVPSIILLEQIRTLDKGRLYTKICQLDEAIMHLVNQALMISIGLK